jgi:hypothetical protein
MPAKSLGPVAHLNTLAAAASVFIKCKKRKVRRIVTVSGRGVRGHFPSLKAVGLAQFESLVEEAALRALEVAPSVEEFQTQPEVLSLTDGELEFTYTPDIRFVTRGRAHYLEVKPDRFRTSERQVRRLHLVRKGMRNANLAWSLVLETELRHGGLQEELKALLRLRPVADKRHRGLAVTRWDPLDGASPDDITATRWANAKAECDALLERVMRRDPGELLPQPAK